jgi:hypothetical protein
MKNYRNRMIVAILFCFASWWVISLGLLVLDPGGFLGWIID